MMLISGTSKIITITSKERGGTEADRPTPDGHRRSGRDRQRAQDRRNGSPRIIRRISPLTGYTGDPQRPP